MMPSAKSKTAERVARNTQRDKEVLQERETADRMISEKIDRLRVLRLARAASDREAAREAADSAAREKARAQKPNAAAPNRTRGQAIPHHAG